MKRHFTAVWAFVATLSVTAHAQPVGTPGTARADLLFAAAKALRAVGDHKAACDKFKEAKSLQPGVGVTLYLADCYEKLGQTATAWRTFYEASQLAAVRGDDRAKVARARAEALEPRLGRLIISNAGSLPSDAILNVDGAAPVPAKHWASGIAVDPGKHSVHLIMPDGTSGTVAIDAAEGATTTATFGQDQRNSRVLPAPTPAGSPAMPAPPPSTSRGFDESSRRSYELGLLGVGAAAVGIGAALLVVKNGSMSNAPNDSPHVDDRAAVGSTLAFAIGGAAVVTSAVLYLAAPKATPSALLVTPVPMLGGVGAVFRATW